MIYRVLGRALAAIMLAAVALMVVPARAAVLSTTDRTTMNAAFSAAGSGRWEEVRRLQGQAKDPVAAKILRWMDLLRPSSGASFQEITTFMDQNPDWPSLSILQTRAEESTTVNTPVALLLTWFGKHPPTTTDGRMAYGRALISAGEGEKGAKVLRDLWVNGTFGSVQERDFLDLYGSQLHTEDHVARLDRLLWDGRSADTQRMLVRVDPAHRIAAQARMMLADQEDGAEATLAKVPAELQNDPGVLYERLRWRRRKDLDEGAYDLLKRAPKNMVRPEAWWTERAVMGRRALSTGRISEAYAIVSHHGLTSANGQSFADAEWLSGWIALRFLQDKKEAAQHFLGLRNGVSSAISKARGAYWLGRTAEAKKDEEQAQRWYAEAEQHATTFYGQLAAARRPGGDVLKLPETPRPTPDEIHVFNGRETVRAARILNELDEIDRLRPFIIRLQANSKTPGEHVLVSNLAISFDRPNLAILAGRRSNNDGVFIVDAAYPMLNMPNVEGAPEKPLVLSLLRQESAFDIGAVSSVGALGLMQLMPATAQKMAKTLNIKYSADKLTEDPEYNIRIGQAYLQQLLNQFNGSYVLSLAAYNAGPGRVSQWLRDLGDPRDPRVDVVDWIESIPFPETRNYIQRVLESVPVYRRRFGMKVALNLEPHVRR